MAFECRRSPESFERQGVISLSLGFSLVEVVLALGIVSFCLVSIFGLLPVGLRSVKNSTEQAGAGNVLTLIASSIRNATTNSSGFYSITNYARPVTWSTGDPTTIEMLAFSNLGLNGNVENGAGRFNARVVITPPTSRGAPGTAEISVAWPVVAEYGTTNWTKADGCVSTVIKFLPRDK